MADENVEPGIRDPQASDPAEASQPENKETAREHPTTPPGGGPEEPDLVPQGAEDSQRS